MLSRRSFATSLLAGLAAPSIIASRAWASDDLLGAIRRLDQLLNVYEPFRKRIWQKWEKKGEPE